MDNHFSKGLMAGLDASGADSAHLVVSFCADYRRGSVLGFSHRMLEKVSDRQLSTWEAGILARRYELDKEMVMNFFKKSQSSTTIRLFIADYRLEA